MDRLISMVAFTLNVPVENKFEVQSIGIQGNTRYQLCLRYANFLSQKLELWQFIPCKLVDGVWVVLEEPEMYECYNCDKTSKTPSEIELCKEYQEAKDRVLFEGFEVFKSVSALISFSNIKTGLGRLDWHIEGGFIIGYSKESTIEDLYNSYYTDLVLTDSAKKQIGI